LGAVKVIRIGLIGDFDPEVKAHVAIPQAIQLASHELSSQVNCEWIPTPLLESDVEKQLKNYQALWVVPASPYLSMQGALIGIQFAREHDVPFLGTCGGFQHMMIEYARNVLGLSEADHAETNPDSPLVLVAPLTCSVSEENHTFILAPDTIVAKIYGRNEVVEQYGICNYGLNPDYRSLFEQSGMKIAGVDTNDEVRIMELPSNRFFIGTLFQPERSAFKNIVHPLIKAFVQSATEQK
jgi:CTP synthase (UTP-ammonia lyase)